MNSYNEKYEMFNKKTTETLIDMYEEYDSNNLSDLNFEIIERILENRNIFEKNLPDDKYQNNKHNFLSFKFIFYSVSIIIVFLCIIINRNSSSEDSNQHNVVSNSSWNSSVHQVVSWLKDNLKDPSSLEFIEWSNVNQENNGNYSVRVKYRAKNSFGGYSIANKIFYLDPSGQIIDYHDY